MLIQAFIPELSIEAFDIGILLRFAGLDEIQLQALAVSPFIQRLSSKLRAVINRNRDWQPSAETGNESFRFKHSSATAKERIKSRETSKRSSKLENATAEEIPVTEESTD